MTDDFHNPEPTDHRERHALFAGGGSGGHVFPGLAVAELLAARGWTVTWAGRPQGMERALVERSGMPYVELPAAPLVGQGLVGKLRALLTLLRSAWRGRRLVRRLGARVVVGTGGYVAAPAVLGARVSGVPGLLLEPNARAGTANRFLSRWATAAAVGFASAENDFECTVETTGTPVRSSFFQAGDRPAGVRGAAGPQLLVVGGSQGAQQINELFPAAVVELAASVPGLHVRHQTGGAHADAVRADYARRETGSVVVDVVPFIDDMPAAMAAADVVVSRAGAITLAEICAAGLPSILVPLRLAGDHQLDNARRLEAAQSAVVLADDALSVSGMSAALEALLADRGRMAAMGKAARGLAVENAAERIADLVEQLAEAA